MSLNLSLSLSSNGDELKKLKHVVQNGVFAAYQFAMETCFLADEGATLPELPLKSLITVALPNKPSSTDGSISTITGFTVPETDKALGSQPVLSHRNPATHPVLGLPWKTFLDQGTPPSEYFGIFIKSLYLEGDGWRTARLFRIKYYGSSDKPLGWFLRDHLFDQSCRSRSSEMPEVFVKKIPEVFYRVNEKARSGCGTDV